MDPLIFNTLNTAASILKASDTPPDALIAAILYTVLGSYQAGNFAAIKHIAETAFDEAQAFVLIHSDDKE